MAGTMKRPDDLTAEERYLWEERVAIMVEAGVELDRAEDQARRDWQQRRQRELEERG